MTSRAHRRFIGTAVSPARPLISTASTTLVHSSAPSMEPARSYEEPVACNRTKQHCVPYESIASHSAFASICNAVPGMERRETGLNARVKAADLQNQKCGFVSIAECALNLLKTHNHLENRNGLCKSKAIPITGRGVLQECEMLNISHCIDNRFRDGGKVVSPTHRPRVTPKKYNFSACDTHFCSRWMNPRA
jgi:hypothetical protein